MLENFSEEALVFECEAQRLVGLVTRPPKCLPCGVLIVVGGPQYRVGSHRQFALLARHLGQNGIAAMRFDYRGMGDSEGDRRSFEAIEADLSAAIDAFLGHVRELRSVVIWGLCDAASAAAMYAHKDARVSGLIMANPWVRTSQSEARAYVRHYYLRRLRDKSWWLKVARGEFAVGAAVSSLVSNLQKSVRAGMDTKVGDAELPLPERMVQGLARFQGDLLLILSGNDLTAQEFLDVSASSPAWQAVLAGDRVTRRTLPEANHTFSSRAWRDRVAAWTTEWVLARSSSHAANSVLATTTLGETRV